MSEQDPHPHQDQAHEPADNQFQFIKIYTKDLSFETPNSPEIFAMEWKPESEVNLRTQTRQLGPDDYEVTLAVTATAKLGDRTAFLVEAQQAGVFKILGLGDDALAQVIGAYCPAMLYPYVREVISDLVSRGGFPPFLLSPVNFDALYAQRRAEVEAGGETPADRSDPK